MRGRSRPQKFKRAGSFGDFVYRHKSKVALVYFFFLGFIATGLAYAAILGELSIFGTTNFTPDTSLKFTKATMRVVESGDTLVTSPDGQVITFHMKFTETNVPKDFDFCISNTTTNNFQLGIPDTTGPTDPNVHVDWPPLSGIIIYAGTVRCDANFRVTVYYTAASPSGETAEMLMKAVYVQI